MSLQEAEYRQHSPRGVVCVLTLVACVLIGCGPSTKTTPADASTDHAPPDSSCEKLLSQHPGRDGVAILKFDITPAGETTNIEIVAACPPEPFGRVAVEAVSKWRYAPTADGKLDQRVLLPFTKKK
ncbi:MAG: TonB family protein [Isosphaeraceae bacterium]|nr:TonB family protein [Isosphaeraceae bacterium]